MFPWSTQTHDQPKDLQKRLSRIESKLDRILEDLGIRHGDRHEDHGLSSTVRDLAEKGRKIEAIKAHREQSGVDLKAAKEAVERYLGR